MSTQSYSDQLEEHDELYCVHNAPYVLERLLKNQLENQIQANERRCNLIRSSHLFIELLGKSRFQLSWDELDHCLIWFDCLTILSINEEFLHYENFDLVLL